MSDKLNKSKLHCLNCDTDLRADEQYCGNCGQKNKFTILSIKDIIFDFFSSTFYFESKIWKSFFILFSPSKTTKEYVAGRRKKYLHPFRLFFVSAVLFFALFNSFASKVIGKIVPQFDVFQIAKNKIKSYDRRTILLDSLQIEGGSSYENNINFVAGLKSSIIPDTIPDRDTIFQLASVVNTGRNTSEELLGRINNRDYYELTPDEIIAKYNITGAFQKVNIKQSIRMSTDPLSSIKYVMNNFIWGVFFVIGICALFLKLLYFRHRVSYVEMLLILFELHAVSFLMATFGMIIQYFFQAKNINLSIFVAGLISFIYLTLGLRNYFKQNIIKTLFKTCLFYFFYLIVLMLFIAITSLVSMILY